MFDFQFLSGAIACRIRTQDQKQQSSNKNQPPIFHLKSLISTKNFKQKTAATFQHNFPYVRSPVFTFPARL